MFSVRSVFIYKGYQTYVYVSRFSFDFDHWLFTHYFFFFCFLKQDCLPNGPEQKWIYSEIQETFLSFWHPLYPTLNAFLQPLWRQALGPSPKNHLKKHSTLRKHCYSFAWGRFDWDGARWISGRRVIGCCELRLGISIDIRDKPIRGWIHGATESPHKPTPPAIPRYTHPLLFVQADSARANSYYTMIIYIAVCKQPDSSLNMPKN